VWDTEEFCAGDKLGQGRGTGVWGRWIVAVSIPRVKEVRERGGSATEGGSKEPCGEGMPQRGGERGRGTKKRREARPVKPNQLAYLTNIAKLKRKERRDAQFNGRTDTLGWGKSRGPGRHSRIVRMMNLSVIGFHAVNRRRRDKRPH